MKLRRLGVAAVIALAVTAAGAARADGGDAAKAAELKKKADALLDSKHFEEALAAYDAAYAVKPNAALLYNRGRALQFLARYPEALAAIREFVKSAPPELRARVAGLAELVADLEQHVATVTFQCDVKGARVLAGGRQLGTCPFEGPIEIGAGHVTFEAFADGYVPFKKELDLSGGGTTTISLALARKDLSAFLLVKSHIAASRAAVDGHVLGVVPAESGPVPAGAHEVAVEHDGYEAARTRVVLEEGEKKEIFLDPIARPGLLTRWWFWTGIGVILAGAATTVILLSTEKSPAPGNFSPGTVTF